jgi:acyl-ACP thioesterase
MKDRVGASRTDTNGIMKLTGAMDIIQDCSLFWIESEPSFRDFLVSNNLGMFIASRQVDILRFPVYGEKITIETRVFACRSFLGYRNTVLYGEDGLPCLLTWGLGAIVNLSTGRMARMPQSEIDKATIDDKVDMELYHHMNNVKYVDIALDFLPENLMINRLRIEYKKPAKLGDLLYPQIIKAPLGPWDILLSDSKDTPYAVMEFS